MKTLVTTLALTLSITATATAQDPGRPGPLGERPRVSPVVSVLDLNNDGRLDANELAKATASLKKLDRNNNGQLSAEELRPAFGGRGLGGGPGAGPGPQGRGPGGGSARGNSEGGPAFTSVPTAKSDTEKKILAVLKDMFETQRRGSMSVTMKKR